MAKEVASVALQDVSPSRRKLQQNELSSEQPACDVQENKVVNIAGEETVSASPPSQVDKVHEEIDFSKGEIGYKLLCAICDKDFLSDISLRSHLENVYPCNQPGSLAMPKEEKVESRTCFKCGKMFASWHRLCKHLNRVNPCDHDTTVRRRTSASKTCQKCGRTFSSSQSLRIHLKRVKPCEQDATTPTSPPIPPVTTLPSTPQVISAEGLKKEDRKAKARYQARKAYLKKRGRLDELEDPPSSCSKFDDDLRRMEKTVPKAELQRYALDESVRKGDGLKVLPSELKKPRLQDEVTQDEDEVGDFPSVVSKPDAQSIQTTSPLQDPGKKSVASEGSFVYQSNHGHGGDLLAGGCSCPPCVRRWARNIMNRMQHLEDEVVMLRQKELAGGESGHAIKTGLTSTITSQARSENLNVSQSRWPGDVRIGLSATDKSAASGHSQANPINMFKSLTSCSSVKAALLLPEAELAGDVGDNPSPFQLNSGPSYGGDFRANISRLDDQQQQQPITIAPGLQGLDTDKKSLVDAYTHSNAYILKKKKKIEELKTKGCAGDRQELQKKEDELRLFVTAEIAKRENTVAALITHEWKDRLDELNALLEDKISHNASRDEQYYHTKWSIISKNVSTKKEIMAELERQMDIIASDGEDNRSRYAEMGELFSKIAAEYAAKTALEGEREEVLMGLVKSSIRIRWLVKNSLL